MTQRRARYRAALAAALIAISLAPGHAVAVVTSPAPFTGAAIDSEADASGRDGVGHGAQLRFAAVEPMLITPSEVDLIARSPGHWYRFHFRARPGTVLTPGTYEVPLGSPGPRWNGPSMDVSGDHRGCSQVAGRFIVDSSAGASFSARFEQHCEGARHALFGVVAHRSAIPFASRTLVRAPLDVGALQVGTTTAVTFAVRSDGPAPLRIASVAVAGPDAQDARIAADGCSGRTLDPRRSCTVALAYAPVEMGRRLVSLRIFDDLAPAGGSGRTVAVQATGAAEAEALTAAFVDGELGSLVADGTTDHVAPVEARLGAGGDVQVWSREHGFSASFAAPRGTPLAAGTYQGAVRVPSRSGDEPGLDVAYGSLGCEGVAGRFTVDRIHIDHDGVVQRFAVRFAHRCEGVPGTLFGAVAINAMTPFRTRTIAPNAIDFGRVPGRRPSEVRDVTVGSGGPSPLTVRAVTLAGPDASSFEIVADGCAGVTLPSASTCSIGVRFLPGRVPSATAALVIADDAAPDGASGRRVLLAGHGSR